MPSEQVERELKSLWEKWQAEEKPNQPSKGQASETLSMQGLLRELRKDKILPEDKPRRGYAYSYPDQHSKDFLVQVNENLLEQAQEEAAKRKLSVSSYIRECLMHRLGKTTLEQEAEIDQLLENCTSLEESEERFIVEGKEGFLSQVAEKGLNGEVWTFSQIDKVAFKLKSSPKSTQDQCLEAMKLDKVQTQYFTTQTEYLRNTEPEKEETYFVPFATCNNPQCHRPLTKDQFSLPNCPYCKGTQATPFVYDKKSPRQPKPYAMCSNCHRALPKEARTWTECKHCGTKEQEIVLNYEGIKRQTPLKGTLTLPKEILETVAEETEES